MKKTALVTAIAGVLAAAAVVVFGVLNANNNKTVFPADGNVLLGEGNLDEKLVPVKAGSAYNVTKAKLVNFMSSEGKRQLQPGESFVSMDDDSTMALSGGVLLDFSDLSGNFINNYYVPKAMRIYKNGSSYEVSTTNGAINFGDHLWKLRDDKYLVCSPELKVYFADNDIRDVKDYVQVSVTEDGVVRLLTSENMWTTLSPECYIQTQNGTKVYPVKQRVEDDRYKISLASLSVDADDLITLTEDEERRQIVPEIQITSVDGNKGDDGVNGTNGQIGIDGVNGTDGRAGTDGMDGTDGEDGAAGAAGTSGGAGISGSAGTSGANGTSGTNGTDGSNGEGGGNGKDGVGGRTGTDAKNGVDGKDGERGTEGGTGLSGSEGKDGENGTNGDDGIAGNSGADGSIGENGGTGDNGASGHSGENGAKGSIGASGKDGDKGSNGDDGLEGDDGTNGTTGGTGAAGRDASNTTSVNSQIPVITIGKWDITSKQLRGSLLVNDPSGFFKALNDGSTQTEKSYPAYVRIYDNVTGRKVMDCYAYDNAEYKTPQTTNFFKQINSLNLAPGEEIFFAINENDTKQETSLQPDHSYRIEVGAYYKSEGQVFNRVFLNRNFYTDSSGLNLVKNKAELRKLIVDADIASGYEDSIVEAEVYLLTPDQNQDFGLDSSTLGTAYVYKYDVRYNETGAVVSGAPGSGSDGRGAAYPNTPVDDKTEVALDYVYVPEGSTTAKPLDKNTHYIARTIVTVDDGISEKRVLSGQELDLWTLKEVPTWKQTDLPIAVYNRVTSAYEVYRPTVNDPDNSAVRYKYVAKYVDNTSPTGYTVVGTQYRTPGEAEPVEFFIPTYYTVKDPTTGEDVRVSYKYRFDVEMETDDNEKAVFYDLGTSDELAVSGTSLPIASCDALTTFNSAIVDGMLQFDSRSSITIDKQHPLYIDISCDGYYENTIALGPKEGGYYGHGIRSSWKISDGTTRVDDDWYATYMSFDNTTNQLSFTLNLLDLYMNQQYVLTVRGCTKIGAYEDQEGEKGVYRDLGTMTFHTKDTNYATVFWAAPTESEAAASESAIGAKLSLTAPPPAEGQEDKNSLTQYERDEIAKGQVVIQLYEGTGTTGLLLGSAYVNSPEDLAKITTPIDETTREGGLLLKDSMFGTDLHLDSESSYTLKVSSISDETYGLPQCSYVNYFRNIQSDTKIIMATPNPPALPQNPAGAIISAPITNFEAPEFGGEYNPKYSNEAIVGYTLQSTYDNSAYLASKVTYNIMEYNDFFNALYGDPEEGIPGTDPVGNYLATIPQYGIPKLVTISKPVDGKTTGSSKLPMIAVLFDETGEVTEPVPVGDSTWNDGYYVYKVPKMQEDPATHVKTGMARGYRYAFAYTVEYDDQTESGIKRTSLYPYGQKNYEAFRDNVGIGVVNGKTRFAGVAYVLNSGMIECPLDDPTFNTYVKQCVPELELDSSHTKDPMTLFAYGNVSMRYHYEDPDGTLSNSLTEKKIYYVYYDPTEPDLEKRNKLKDTELKLCTEAEPWQPASFKFSSQISTLDSEGGDTFIYPKIRYTVYKLIYDPMLDYYGMDHDDTEIGMGVLHCDWDWDGFIDAYNAKATAGGQTRIPRVVMTSRTDLNYIQFNFLDSDSGAGDKTETVLLAQRAFGAEITAVSEVDPGKKKVFPPIKMAHSSDGRYFVRISIGDLGDLPAGKVNFSVRLLFDNGNSGWDYSYNTTDTESAMGTTNMFGLYYIKMNELGVASRNAYLVQENETNPIAGGGLFDKLGGYPAFEAAVLANPKIRFQANYAYKFGTENKFTKYIYPFRYGVDANGTNKNLGVTDGNILFPKQVSRVDAHFVGTGGGGGEFSMIIPTVHYADYNGMMYNIALNDFYVTGLTSVVKHTATKSEADAFNLGKLQEEAFGDDTFYICNIGLFDAEGKDKSIPRDINNVGDESKGFVTTTKVILNKDGTVFATCVMDADGKIVNGSIQKVIRTTSGEPPVTTVSNLVTLKGKNGENLLTDHDYRINFFMELITNPQEDVPVTRDTILIGADYVELQQDDTKAVYDVATSNGVTISVKNASYDENNTSYFSKGFSTKFDIKPRAYGVAMDYELYLTPEDARRGHEPIGKPIPGEYERDEQGHIKYDDQGNPIMKKYDTEPADPYLVLKKGNDSYGAAYKYPFLTEPIVLASSNNVITADMTPETIRAYNADPAHAAGQLPTLIPGTPYYIRLTARDAQGNEVGYSVNPVNPSVEGSPAKNVGPRKASYGAVIGLQAAGDTYISYNVTLSNSQYVFMGYHYDDTEDKKHVNIPVPEKMNNGGLFAVRFTDAQGNKIPSDYDNMLFSFNDQKQTFTIGTSGTSLIPGTPYYCNIYAVYDEDLDGWSLPTSTALGSEKSWDFFFKDMYPVMDATGSLIIGYRPGDKSATGVITYKDSEFNKLIDKLWDPAVPEEEKALIRTNFLRYSQSKMTTNGGISIPDGMAKFTAATTAGKKAIRLNLKECVGVVTRDVSGEEQQGFEKVEWQIQDLETAEYYDGTSLVGENDMFHFAAGSEANFYYDMIPKDYSFVTGTEYTIVLKVYVHKTDAEAFKTFSDSIIY